MRLIDCLQRTVRILVGMTGLVMLLIVCPAGAQDTGFEKLKAEALTLHGRGNYVEAAIIAQQALDLAEKSWGPDHPNVAAALRSLADAVGAQNRFAQAEPLYKRSLAIREKALGPDHPDVANSLSGLAELYYNQGQRMQAELALKRVVAILEKALGSDHPDVAASRINLAALYNNQGQFAQAESLYKRALPILEKNLGSDHPNVAITLSSIAELYQAQGRYAEAELLYQRALPTLEKALGPDHPNVAYSLANFAGLHLVRGQYAQAEPLLKRALTIRKKTLGPDHPIVATSLNNLAELYRAQGQYAQAEPLLKRALLIAEKTLGPDHPNVALSLNNLALLFSTQSKYAEAEPLLKRALAVNEKTLGSDHPVVATTLNNLGQLYKTQGQYVQAEPYNKRAVAILEKALGPDHPDVATMLLNLADLYKAQGQYAKAETLLKRALPIAEKALGPDHANVALSLNNLAELYRAQGQYAQAEPLYKRSLAILERIHGPNHPQIAFSLNNLALLYTTQAQYVKAEPHYKRTLTIFENALGPDHPDLAASLNNLAELYRAQGQYASAEPLFKRALAIVEKALGSEHPNVALSLNNLALMYDAQRKYVEAEPLYKRSLAILEKALGPDHPDVATSLNNLAELDNRQGQYAQAELLMKRALAIREKALGPDHPDVAKSLHNLAALYDDQRQYARAEPLFKRALEIWEQTLGPDHPNVAVSLNNLAARYERQGQTAEALTFVRRASAIYRQRIIAGGTGDAAIREAVLNRRGFAGHLLLLSRNPNKEPVDQIADESLQIAQLAKASSTASAIAKMASRFARDDDALASLIKRKQDASERRSRNETQLVSASAKPPKQRDTNAEQSLRDEIVSARKETETIDDELTRRFPEYQELTRPEPATVNQVRALLKPGEAMIVHSGFIWVIRQDGAVFLPLQANARDTVGKIAKVRAEMEFDAAGRLRPVSINTLHELYQSLFVPALPHLDGIKHVMLVTGAALQSFPFSMLVASKPPEIKSDADYRQVDWLARHYAFSVLPSVSSIQAFRQFTKANTAPEPFAGFGDPIIGEPGGTTRGKRSKTNIASLFRNVPVRNAANANQITEVADVEAIRSAPRLQETADELRAIAKVLKSDQKSLWLQENATETKVKQLDLAKYRTIAFATHGVMAGEIEGIGEPGLILTPPPQGTIEDDGYLSASEIAKLKLNADWVVLSACNTAAADGTPGAEGLSGLAKAFFYAGARSLLVSHWPVASEATVPLTTAMLSEYENRPELGKAEAHRKAMIALINTPDHAEYAHPLFWAPFVVVGEGGAGKVVKSGAAQR